MDYLIDERGREFAFEGIRLFDILRWGIGVEKVSGQKLGAHYENLHTGEIFLWNIGRSQVFQPHHHLWPIPQSEINANDNILAADKNTGYKLLLSTGDRHPISKSVKGTSIWQSVSTVKF